MAEGAMVKVLLQEGDNVETLWAIPVGKNLYKLDNSPFWAYGVSWNDVVETQADSDGMLRMTRVAQKSGHRTVRVHFPREQAESFEAKNVLQRLNEFGATYEGMNPTYLAVDVPPGVDLAPIATYLTEQEVEWEHADPTYDELHKA